MAYEVREQQAHYQVLFEDDGSGVPADYRSQIFEPFGRGTSEADGSGIGLSVCRDYARSALSGDLAYVDSELGGAGFCLTGVLELANLISRIEPVSCPRQSKANLFCWWKTHRSCKPSPKRC